MRCRGCGRIPELAGHGPGCGKLRGRKGQKASAKTLARMKASQESGSGRSIGSVPPSAAWDLARLRTREKDEADSERLMRLAREEFARDATDSDS